MRKIVIFSYSLDDDMFTRMDSMILFRETEYVGNSDKKEVTYAKSTKPDSTRRVIIAPTPEKVFHNEYTDTFNIWFDDPGPSNNDATNILGTYISNYFDGEIERLKNDINYFNLKKEQLTKAMNNNG